MRPVRIIGATFLLAACALAQQPNTPFASLTVEGINGPTYPMTQNVRRSTMATIVISGAGATGTFPLGQPFALFQSATGQLHPAAGLAFGDLVDIPLAPPPYVVLDSIAHPELHTDPGSGVFQLGVFVPSTVPLNLSVAFQAAIGDPSAFDGFSLTAAVRLTVVNGPTVVNMTTGIGTFGDSGIATVNLQSLSLPLPFYGQNFSVVHVSGDGYMTFGGSQSPDFTPSDLDMVAGPPRVAGFWCDLDQGVGETIRYTVDSNPGGGAPGFMKVEFISVSDAGGVGYRHSFDWTIDATGLIDIHYSPANNASIYDTVCGIGPGGNISTVAMKDLSTMLSPNSRLGTANESFWEWFGTPGMPYYTPAIFRPFDLYTRHLTFLPQGSGALPGSTNRYVLY